MDENYSIDTEYLNVVLIQNYLVNMKLFRYIIVHLIITCIYLNIFSISNTHAQTMSEKVHEWSDNLGQKFNKFTKDYMRMPELQKKFDAAPRSETILSGNVIAASTATRITLLMEQKETILISMGSKIKSLMITCINISFT